MKALSVLALVGLAASASAGLSISVSKSPGRSLAPQARARILQFHHEVSVPAVVMGQYRLTLGVPGTLSEMIWKFEDGSTHSFGVETVGSGGVVGDYTPADLIDMSLYKTGTFEVWTLASTPVEARVKLYPKNE